MTRFLSWIVLALFCGSRAAMCEAPHIQYVFPAGGQQGTSFDLEVGGLHLDGATNVFVTGEGVRVEIVRFGVRYEPRQFRQLHRGRENSMAALEGKEGAERRKLERRIQGIETRIEKADLPDGVDPYDKKAVARYMKVDKKEQFNPQISHRLYLKVTLDEKAPPGDRELRVYTPSGLSNPLCFQVGTLAESRETEPNDDHMKPGLQEVSLPVIINGQVRPGDIDHFRFKANKGDSIVVDVQARRIIPYLADAVPGWFQAVAALYDEDGNEVAYQDDYKFHPDPVLFFDVPEAGIYTLSIRDSIYRGREDFIYRIAIGELPFITSIFPLGARQGNDVAIALSGRNLPKTQLTGRLPTDASDIRHVSVKKEGYRSNEMPFAIGDMNELMEVEPNDSDDVAQPVHEPLVVNGRIRQPGDVDVFSFNGREGDSVSIEVIARRLNSPLDSYVSLRGPGIEIAVRNDDNVNKDKTHLHLGAGLVTHHADSYLLHELPASGVYTVEIGDTQGKGGHDYGYRLRISEAHPDFSLRMEPSGIHIAPGGTAAFTVLALRQDGFDGKITLNSENLPPGFSMSMAEIPQHSDITRFTITAPREMAGGAVSPEITGTGVLNGRPVTHPAVPVDDQMQAFLYRHLVPARELVLAPVSSRPPISFEARLPKSGIIELPVGEETRIRLEGRVAGPRNGYTVKLDSPPEGITLVKGWIGRKQKKEKTADGKPIYVKNEAAGSVLLSVDEALEPGTELSLVVVAEMKRGKEITFFPAPAIPVKIVKQ